MVCKDQDEIWKGLKDCKNQDEICEGLKDSPEEEKEKVKSKEYFPIVHWPLPRRS